MVKKGEGTLTLSGTTPFAAEDIIVYRGSVVVGGVTYGVNAVEPIDASAGGELGTMTLHGDKLEAWLEGALDYSGFSVSGVNGGTSFEKPVPFTVAVGAETKTYINLETGTTYNDELGGVDYSFTTKALAPRTLQIDTPSGAVTNVRDVGSWPLESLDGKKMNQGVIFRGGNLDDFITATPAQKTASVLTQLGLRTEIELRPVGVDQPAAYSGVTASFAADNCEYYDCGMSYNGGPQLDSGNDGNFTNQIRRVFSKFGTANSLPAYFHCRIGRDRTGMVGLLLLGLMGVEEEVLYRDYLVSNFAKLDSGLVYPSHIETSLRYLHRGWCRNNGEYVYNDNDYGLSVAARCRAYLEMCGVTASEIANITQALSGETPAEVLARVDAYETQNNFRTVSYVDYEGSSTTNAMHRLAAGRHILPTATPTRTGFTFQGWDVENETQFAEGQSVVYALWEKDTSPTVRFWADENGDSEQFNRVESWDPEPESMANVAIDTLVLNKGVDKIATFGDGDSVTASNVYVGYGPNSSSDNDKGGRLDVTGGTLTVTNYFRLGNEYSDYSNNVVNVSGGKLSVRRFRMSNCGSGEGKCDTLNVSGTGVFEATADEVRLAADANGTSYVNVSNGGSFTSAGDVYVGYSGTACLTVDGGSLDLNGHNLYIGRSGATRSVGEVVVTNGTVAGKYIYLQSKAAGSSKLTVCDGSRVTLTEQLLIGSSQNTVGEVEMTGGYLEVSSELRIGSEAGSEGVMRIAGNSCITNKWALYIGKKGRGILTIDGGEVCADISVKFGEDSAAVAGNVLNLNGGVLKTAEFRSPNVLSTINWNGGTITGWRDSRGYVTSGNVFLSDDANRLKINVLGGGAIYESVNDGRTYQINIPLSGPGAIVKRGNDPLRINATADVRGGIRVEGGSLIFGSGCLVGGAMKPMAELSVAKDCSLDLGGADITVLKYTLEGVDQADGTYSAFGGTVRVASSIDMNPASAIWTNVSGDGDFDNPDNWIAKNASGATLPASLPGHDTDVLIQTGAVRPDFSGLDVKSVSLYVSADTYLRGNCSVPAVVKEAKCWFDFDDEATVTMDGETSNITSITNKGTAAETLPTADVYNGGNGKRLPRYGEGRVNGRKFLSMSNLDGSDDSVSWGLRTGELKLGSNDDRTIVVASRRGNALPHQPFGIESTDGQWNYESGHFRIQRDNDNGTNFMYCDTAKNGGGWTGNAKLDAKQDPTEWAVGFLQSETVDDVITVSLRDYSLQYGLTTNSATATDLNTKSNAKLYIGMAYGGPNHTPGVGQVGEAMYFDRALTTDEQVAIQNYLVAKWVDNGDDMSNMPTNLVIENGATIDFGGGWWTFGTITGSGTIGTANVTITGSMDPGLTVGGKVVFANGATINLAALPKSALGTTVTFLTADSIENFPRKVRGGGRISSPCLVDNGDGTVSLVGTVSSDGFSIRLR